MKPLKTEVGELEHQLLRRIDEIRSDQMVSVDHPKIAAWYTVYKSLGFTGRNKAHPSVASLVRRIKKGDSIPFISPLVAISNYVSLQYLFPSGLIDLQNVSGPLVLGHAAGTESFQAIGGDQIAHPDKDEIAYFDEGSNQILCRFWNSRGSRLAAVSPNTNSAVIDIDTLGGTYSEGELEQAIGDLCKLVARHFQAKIQQDILDAGHQEFTINR